jgi:hypothetical protein
MTKISRKELADRIEMDKKPWVDYVLPIMAAAIGYGMYLSPTEWYWGIGFTIFFTLAFIARMKTWKIVNTSLELMTLVVPNLILITTLSYLYYQERLDLGVIIQVVVATPFSIIMSRKLFSNQVKQIVSDLRK